MSKQCAVADLRAGREREQAAGLCDEEILASVQKSVAPAPAGSDVERRAQ